MQNRKIQGFTLIELMIVVAVLAILASIAMASYESSVIKTRRAAAAACALEAAQFMERYYTTNLKYTDAELPQSQCQTDIANHYTIRFVGTPSARAYTIEAAPKGAQLSKDTKCGKLSIDQRGTRSVSGTGAVKDCW